jgi:predicted PurR-regulated permease PerM
MISDERHSFASRAFLATVIVLASLLALLLLWYAARALLLGFAGILFAIALMSIADLLVKHARMPYGLAVAVALLLMIVVIVGVTALIVPSFYDQVNQLRQSLPATFDALQKQAWVRQLGLSNLLAQLPGALSLERIVGFFSATYNAVLEVFLVLFIGLALALEPGTYAEGLLAFLPFSRRPRAREVMGALHTALRRWLVGQLLSMLAVGILTIIGLEIVGMPLALTLGIIAGFLEFIPTLGPLLAAVPAVLLAIPRGFWPTVTVILVYSVVQLVENYVLVPFIHRRTVSVAPVLAVIAIILFGALFGALGVLLAMPLAAVVVVLVKELYFRDVLGEKTA